MIMIMLDINKRILLGYGRVTGADAYGELIRGARIIDCMKVNLSLYLDCYAFRS